VKGIAWVSTLGTANNIEMQFKLYFDGQATVTRSMAGGTNWVDLSFEFAAIQGDFHYFDVLAEVPTLSDNLYQFGFDDLELRSVPVEGCVPVVPAPATTVD
jgi:hypothetical protein